MFAIQVFSLRTVIIQDKQFRQRKQKCKSCVKKKATTSIEDFFLYKIFWLKK